MSDSVTVGEKEYISSKRASELSGYAQDYIGQLARRGLIDASRIGGLWFVLMDSLLSYKSTADTFKPKPPERVQQAADPDSLITFDGKDYISAGRASKLTGYNQDYVGQLARSGDILSRQVGNRWYVEREALLSHKKEKDALLAAVQAQSVGIVRAPQPSVPERSADSDAESEPFFSYFDDERELLPVLSAPQPLVQATYMSAEPLREPAYSEDEASAIPIRVLKASKTVSRRAIHTYDDYKSPSSARSTSYRSFSAAALTILIVLSFGLVTLKDRAIYATVTTPAVNGIANSALAAESGETFGKVIDLLESWVAPELYYKSSQ